MKRRIFVGYSVVTPLLSACAGGLINDDSGAQRPVVAGENATPPANPSYTPGVARNLSWDAQGKWTMDRVPFQFFGSELHPCRIPYAHWEQRIRMVRALGCNTLSVYIMWNYHERGDGSFDFGSDNRRMGEFIDLCGKHGLWVTVRPGPYVCAEWDFGGLPPRMLADPRFRNDQGVVQIRGNFPAYMEACQLWNNAVYAHVVKGRTLKDGGPIMLVALENEYTSWSPIDGQHVVGLAEQWRKVGYTEKFTACDVTATGFTDNNISLPADCAYGMTANGDTTLNYTKAANNYHVGIYGSECYSTWFTRWGEDGQKISLQSIARDIGELAHEGRSCVLYVGHGGTSFAYSAGSNGTPHIEVQPCLTSYDYGAPINEAGGPGANFFQIRDAYIANAHYAITYLEPPAQPPAIADAGIATLNLPDFGYASYFDAIAQFQFTNQPSVMGVEWMAWQLNKQAGAGSNVYPSGLVFYETVLPQSGDLTLQIEMAPDMALVFVNGRLVRERPLSTHTKRMAADGPNVAGKPTMVQVALRAVPARAKLHIVCLPFGRLNWGSTMSDEGKGLRGKITLGDGTSLSGWRMGLCQLTQADLQGFAYLPQAPAKRQPFVARASFHLSGVAADAYLDMGDWGQGYVFVNGHNLGRFWSDMGPQQRLYCPAEWLQSGKNTLHVLEFTAAKAASVRFFGGNNLPYLPNPAQAVLATMPVTGSLVQLENVNNGYVLDALAGTGGLPTLAAVAMQPGVESQWWQLTRSSAGAMVLSNHSNGLLLTPQRGLAGTKVVLAAATSGNQTPQSWHIRPLPGAGSVFTLQSLPSGLYLDIDQASKSPTTLKSGAVEAGPVLTAQVTTNNKTWPYSQQWRLRTFREPLKNGAVYTVSNLNSGLYLMPYKGGKTSGTFAAQGTASGQTDQQWRIQRDAANDIILTNVGNGLVLQVGAGRPIDNPRFELGKAGERPTQRFTAVLRGNRESYLLQEVHSGLALNVSRWSKLPTDEAKNGVLALWDVSNGDNASWIFQPVT